MYRGSDRDYALFFCRIDCATRFEDRRSYRIPRNIPIWGVSLTKKFDRSCPIEIQKLKRARSARVAINLHFTLNLKFRGIFNNVAPSLEEASHWLFLCSFLYLHILTHVHKHIHEMRISARYRLLSFISFVFFFNMRIQKLIRISEDLNNAARLIDFFQMRPHLTTNFSSTDYHSEALYSETVVSEHCIW